MTVVTVVLFIIVWHFTYQPRRGVWRTIALISAGGLDTMNAKTNQQQQQFGSSVEVVDADHHQPLFDFHRAHPLTDEPTLVRLDPYQQQQIYPPPPALNHHHPAQQHPSVYLAPSSSCNIQQQHRSSFSSSNGSPFSVQQQQHGSTQRLDIRNLLLAPPAAARNVRDGRGSVSAPATPVDDSSGGLAIAASTVATAAVPLNFNVSSSGSSSSTTNCASAAASGNKNNSALGKFMMKKVNSYSSGATMTGSAPSDCVLRDLIHPAHADALKAHSALAMKLLKTGKDSTCCRQRKKPGLFLELLMTFVGLSLYIIWYIRMCNWITSTASYIFIEISQSIYQCIIFRCILKNSVNIIAKPAKWNRTDNRFNFIEFSQVSLWRLQVNVLRNFYPTDVDDVGNIIL